MSIGLHIQANVIFLMHVDWNIYNCWSYDFQVMDFCLWPSSRLMLGLTSYSRCLFSTILMAIRTRCWAWGNLWTFHSTKWILTVCMHFNNFFLSDSIYWHASRTVDTQDYRETSNYFIINGGIALKNFQ